MRKNIAENNGGIMASDRTGKYRADKNGIGKGRAGKKEFKNPAAGNRAGGSRIAENHAAGNSAAENRNAGDRVNGGSGCEKKRTVRKGYVSYGDKAGSGAREAGGSRTGRKKTDVGMKAAAGAEGRKNKAVEAVGAAQGNSREFRKSERGVNGKTAGMKWKAGKGEQRGNAGPQSLCPVYKKCGGCSYLHMSYEQQLKEKQKQLQDLLGGFGKLEPIIGMENPWHYRNKVHAVFSHDKKGNPISGIYEAGSHRVVPVDSCLIEDEKSDAIIVTIRSLLKSFKIRTFDEDTGYGLLRHVLIRRGFTTGEIMVVLVLASPVLPSKNNFIKALRKEHPEITTVVVNVNGRGTSMVLGDKETAVYGRGYIEDVLCGKVFRISPKSFYQVNPVQTEILYSKTVEWAGLTGGERVLDAYCGIGTIGLVASDQAAEVIGVELNKDAVRDAGWNVKRNQVKNMRVYCADATQFILDMAAAGEKLDVIFLDPPRSGSTEEFIHAVGEIRPDRVVYISCNPETLARDLKGFLKVGFGVEKMVGVDCFGWTGHVEVCVKLCRR